MNDISTRKSINRALSLLFLFILSINFSGFSQTENYPKYAQQALMTVKVLEKYHYKPKTLDNKLSEELNNELINTLDPTGIYYTKQDILEIKKWDTRIDDEIIDKSTVYLKFISDLFLKRLHCVDSIINSLSETPLDFSEKDTLFYYNTKKEIRYAENDKALAKRWKKLLKNQVLETLYTPTDKIEDPYSMDVKELLKNEPEIRKKITARYVRSIKKITEHADGYANYIASLYVSRMVSLYDPHSDFFSASDKSDFESSLSTSELSFGLYFKENENGEIEIVNLTPGGSAWKSNQLHKGDVILKIKPKTSPLIDFTTTTSDEASELIGSFKDTEAEFTIRKSSGQIKNIVLTKSKIRSDENVVKSYLLTGDKKVGYISLPSFYTDWENNNPLGCANDVAKEIVKLQEENIEALVIDLRYNGGGSVREAMGLIGLFVDEGPLCIYKTRNEKPYLLKDINRGTAYNGPLAIMVNGMSASASEIVSASLQDYNRAIIVGSSTYGKSTGQIIIPLDTTYSLAEIMHGAVANRTSDLGYLKITTEGFYRVTNATHQKKGVQADVNLLEPYYYEEYKEASYPNALLNDSITKKVMYQPLAAIPIATLKEQSQKRLMANANFARLTVINDSLQALSKKENVVLLNPQFFKKNEKKYKDLNDEMNKRLYDSTETYTVMNNNYEKKLIEFDEFTKEINQRSITTIQEDIYIEEVYNILRDLLTFGKN